MTVYTEGRHPAEFLIAEDDAQRSRDVITIAAGEGVLEPGHVVGEVAKGTGGVTVTRTNVSGAGKGALTLADPAYGDGVKAGVYKVVIVEPATDGGAFVVEGPDGVIVGNGTVGVAFDGPVKFTLADGSSDFAAGDTAKVTVAIADGAATGQFRSADPTNTDGSGSAKAVILYGVDATSAAVKVTAIVREAVVNANCLAFDAAVDTGGKIATKLAELKAVGVIAR